MHNTTCDGIWDALSAYADGAASPKEVELVEGHIVACATCARDLAFMRETTLSLGNVPEVMPPPYLREAILAATIHRVPWYRRIFTGAPARGLAMAGALAAVLGIVLISRSPGNAPTDITGLAPVETPRVAEATVQPKVGNKPANDAAAGVKPAARKDQEQLASNQHPVALGPQMRVPLLRVPVEVAAGPKATLIRTTTPVRPRAAGKSTVKPTGKAKTDSLSAPDDMSDDDLLPPDMDISPDSPATGNPMIADAKSGNMGPMGKPTPNPIPNPVPPVVPAKTRLTLVASGGDSMSPGQVASLADLRKSARRPSESVFNPSVFHTMDRRELRIDIYKSRF